MKSKLYSLCLMILPLALFLLVINLKHARGEFYLYDNYDGPYGYLLGSLSMAQFLKPGYFHHPGIVTLLCEAIIVKFTFILQGNEPNIVLDVFNRPEFYFNRINVVLNFLIAFSIYVYGKIVFKKTRNIYSAIFLQLTPFISVLIIYELTHNAAEATALILILTLLTLSVSFVYEDFLNQSKIIKYIIFFGISCGFIIVNAISYLPLMIIPFLLLKKFSHKIFFVLVAIFTFSLLYFTIAYDSSKMWDFVFRSLVHSGKYGSGSANFIDFNRFAPTFELMYNRFFFFSIIYSLIIITILLQFIPKLKVQIRLNKFFLLMLGIFIIMTAYIILVIKQIEGYYLFPGLLFSITGLFAVNSIMTELFPRYFKFSKYIYIYAIFIIFSLPIYKSYKNHVAFFANRKYESYKMVNFLKDNFTNKIVISSDHTSSMPTAFFNGLNYTGDETVRYDSLLMQKYPNYIYFQRWRKDFIYLKYDKELENRLMNSDTLIFHSANDANFQDFKEKFIDFSKKPNTQFNEVFANKNGEKIYVVLPKAN